MSAASEVSLIFTTELYSCLCNAIFFIFLTKGKNCIKNTPITQYSLLLTSDAFRRRIVNEKLYRGLKLA